MEIEVRIMAAFGWSIDSKKTKWSLLEDYLYLPQNGSYTDVYINKNLPSCHFIVCTFYFHLKRKKKVETGENCHLNCHSGCGKSEMCLWGFLTLGSGEGQDKGGRGRGKTLLALCLNYSLFLWWRGILGVEVGGQVRRVATVASSWDFVRLWA